MQMQVKILSRCAPRRALSPLLSPIPLPLPSSSFVCSSCQRSLRRFSVTPNRQRAPDPPPASGYAHLTSRRLISVAGPDAPKFLHGIITQSIVEEPDPSGKGRRQRTEPTTSTKFAGAGAKLGFYGALLNAMGRVLHDVFIYRDLLGLSGADGAPDEAFVVEVDAAQVDALARHLRRYKLRSNLTCRILSEDEYAVWQVWDDTAASEQQQENEEEEKEQLKWLRQAKRSIVLPDTRAPGMGWRVLSRGTGGNGSSGGLQLDLDRADDDAYRVRRYLRGVAEGQAEIVHEQALPLESNMDVTGGVDFHKGCYVGQELTIRTRHRGVVRKRILPCLLYPSAPSSSPPEQLEYRPNIDSTGLSAEDVPPNLGIGRPGAKGRSAGTWLTGVGNIGLALCRLQIMTDVELPGETAAGAPFDPARNEFFVEWGAVEERGSCGRNVKVKAFVPEWLRDGLRESEH
ncbi:Aminomethyltransferase folate-binding domain-containing protein [Hypoxylon crocopeplum]|nr:Aminomethyltransferase folate-binding domain-containing protein [Hypoxylon crocopeplum]